MFVHVELLPWFLHHGLVAVRKLELALLVEQLIAYCVSKIGMLQLQLTKLEIRLRMVFLVLVSCIHFALIRLNVYIDFWLLSLFRRTASTN